VNLDFEYKNKYYNIEIINPYYLPATYNYPPEFDYTVGEVVIDGNRVQGEWFLDSELENRISDLVYDTLMEE